MVQWLKLCTSNAGDASLILGWGTKISHVMRCSQKIKKKPQKTPWECKCPPLQVLVWGFSCQKGFFLGDEATPSWRNQSGKELSASAYISPSQTLLLLCVCLPLAPWQDKDTHCFQGWLKRTHRRHLFSGGNAYSFFFGPITWHMGS